MEELFSKLFDEENQSKNVPQQDTEPKVVDIHDEDEEMNWAMEKSRLTLHYFEDCLESPAPGQQYFSIKVKIEDFGRKEHIWLTEPSFDEEGNVFGTIGNEPVGVENVRFDRNVGIDRKLVSDWMIIENGRLIGGYTIRVLRGKLSGDDLINFDRGFGIMIDEGEDYFLPSDATPEGAIVKIEEAFLEGDIEKVIECKDFVKEAELMLSKTSKEDFDDEIIEKTAEDLRLSFIKSLQENGIPNFTGVKRAFPKREKISKNHMIVTEVCFFPNGSKSVQRLNTYKSDAGWKVLHPENY